ncbi:MULTISPECIES: DNA-directed RNA polymerase subunit beta [Thermodesulfovibrio]|uniref:DNA-directed RNA polymerase subunit beta n=1 Tax=Thermodesulfovibrio yellowstonii TaxID=28262 RepID=A0A9W6LKG9_9BACT|nr:MULTISPECIES: DNA-directed RNA polymerase subunit beta [Thermodesulfovibrio]GLI53253.1 DNA-directed RNA polymerase subunit beta [Thermodesulfovibrio islandicus]
MIKPLRERINFGKVPPLVEVPYLLEFQRKSFDKFLQKDIPPEERADEGLQSALNSVFPISDYNGTTTIEFISYSVGEPKLTPYECMVKGLTYSVPIKMKVRLNIWDKDEEGRKFLKESREQEVFLGDLPMMTETGSFIINGVERVIVSQLHRSPGVYFAPDRSKSRISGRFLYSARIIPVRGSWLDFEFDSKDLLYVRIDKRKKLPATIVLKALGYTNEDLLRIFYPIEEIRIKDETTYTRVVSDILTGVRTKVDICSADGKDIIVKEGSKITRYSLKKMKELGIQEIPISKSEIIGRITLSDIVDPETGEVIVDSNKEITEESFHRIISARIQKLELLFIDNINYLPSLRETLLTDKVENKKHALREIYKKLRPGEPATEEAAEELFYGLFFDPKRYDLSSVGRLKLNQKLGLDIPLDVRVLTDKDIIEIVKYLLNLRTGKGEVDDIDHLGNRRVRGVGELLENQFRIGLVRMERAIREKMTITDVETAMPHDVINTKPVMAAVKEFFSTSQLSQFMDQTNPLSEITHKRRLSALGPGGLTRERAGFEVRDVHPTHYGRICPIETPEGPNIGLITSLATYARINDFGFIESPYRKVVNGKVTNDVHFLSALESENYVIAEATTPVDEEGNIIGETVSARVKGDFKMVSREEVEYMDVSPKQIVSLSASLIPFLENDDANRALMGSNMQRQAVPLIHTEAPIVGTGMELYAARDSGWLVVAKRAGIVENVDSRRIVIRVTEEGGGVDIYNLVKFHKSNQSTCMTQKPIVKVGQTVERGTILADGPCMDNGELALGRNVLVAFMPWGGYNFEDAILVSERLVKEDVYTSIHIDEFEIECRDTKLGPEEITREIPNVNEELLKNLDEDGIIRIGAKVKAGDILVGKVTPKGERVLTPEEKLLYAIFGEKAEDVKESCLYVPPGIEGVVIDVKILTRKGKEKSRRANAIEEEEIKRIERDREDEIRILKETKASRIRKILKGKIILEDVKKGEKIICPKGKALTEKVVNLLDVNQLLKLKVEDPDVKAEVSRVNKEVEQNIKQIYAKYNEKIERIKKGDELPPGVNQIVKVYIAMKRKIQVGDKMAGRHGNKGVVSMILPEEDMPYLEDGTPVDIVLNPLGVPSRMNVGQILETHLGLAAKALGLYVASPVFEGAKEDEIKEMFKKVGYPTTGQVTLYDGKTGEPFERPVTVGYMYMLKLHHLVADKIHARSIGPYSLVTQQPLGGKAQFGGQRLGEMEVWALEAYGAAYTLQEFLTVKSDDITGRTRMYEAIVKGHPVLEPGVPESFNVLIKELQSLCLDVDLLEKKKKVERFQ